MTIEVSWLVLMSGGFFLLFAGVTLGLVLAALLGASKARGQSFDRAKKTEKEQGYYEG